MINPKLAEEIRYNEEGLALAEHLQAQEAPKVNSLEFFLGTLPKEQRDAVRAEVGEDPSRIAQLAIEAGKLRQRQYFADFAGQPRDYVNSIKDNKLVELAAAVKPVETGEERHDQHVKAHKTIHDMNETLRKVNSDNDAEAQKAVEGAEKLARKYLEIEVQRVAKEEERKTLEYLQEQFPSVDKKALTPMAKTCAGILANKTARNILAMIERSPVKVALQYLASVTKEFYAGFGDDKEAIADYVRDTLVAAAKNEKTLGESFRTYARMAA